MALDEARVYIIEDEIQTRASFEAILTSLGYTTVSFGSAEQFLAAIRENCMGCVIADYRLPGINGLELFRQLQSQGQPLPVILTSAYFNVRIAAGALEEGVFAVIEKPFTQNELENSVQRAMQKDRASRKKWVYRLDMEHRLQSLDDRQKLALQFILAGQPNKTIERRLGVSRRTVERTRAAILEKMNAMSFVELATALAEVRAHTRIDLPAEPAETAISAIHDIPADKDQMASS